MQKVQQRPASAFVNIAGNACAAIVFAIHACCAQRATGVIATHRHRLKGAGVDSESRTLAIKKFLWLRRKRRVSARQNRIFGRIAGTRFAGAVLLPAMNGGSRSTRGTCLRPSIEVTKTISPSPRASMFRCRAWISGDRSRPAGWPCRRMTSSPGRQTSRRVAAWLWPARPCQDWPR
jgi:hypothetical protein